MIGIDGAGVYGTVLHWSLTIAFFGSSLLVFLYLWKRGRLDMDEEASIRMMQVDDSGEA